MFKDESDDDFFGYLADCRDLKKKIEDKDIRVSFETRNYRKVCVLKQDSFTFGVMGETPEKAFREAARWVLGPSGHRQTGILRDPQFQKS